MSQDWHTVRGHATLDEMLRRLGLPWILLVASGVAASGALRGVPEAGSARVALAALAAVALAALLAARRLLHELRDIARDQVAHPERPLPSGRALPEPLWKWVRGLAALAFVLALALSLAARTAWSPLSCAACVAFLWLSLREFYLGEILPESPGLRGFAHSAFALPLALFALSAGSAPFDAKGMG